MLKRETTMGVDINKIYNENCFNTMKQMDDNFVDIVMKQSSL